MRHLPLVGVAVYVALVFGTTVHAQQPAPPPAPLPEYGPTVTLEQAMKVANAALAEAKKLNVAEAITIVDNEGRLVYFLKMDDLRQIGVDLSQGKARTSAFTKVPSKAYEDRVASGRRRRRGPILRHNRSSGWPPNHDERQNDRCHWRRWRPERSDRHAGRASRPRRPEVDCHFLRHSAGMKIPAVLDLDFVSSQ